MIWKGFFCCLYQSLFFFIKLNRLSGLNLHDRIFEPSFYLIYIKQTWTRFFYFNYPRCYLRVLVSFASLAPRTRFTFKRRNEENLGRVKENFNSLWGFSQQKSFHHLLSFSRLPSAAFSETSHTIFNHLNLFYLFLCETYVNSLRYSPDYMLL